MMLAEVTVVLSTGKHADLSLKDLAISILAKSETAYFHAPDGDGNSVRKLVWDSATLIRHLRMSTLK